MLPSILDYLPYNKMLYSWLCGYYLRSQKLESAILLLRKGIKIAPYDIDLRWWLNRALLNQGNYSEALSHFQFMLANWPENKKDPKRGWFAQIHALMGQCLLFLGNIKDAQEEVSIAQKIAPWDLDACRTAIDLYYCTNRFDEIPAMLDAYIQKYPQLYPAYIWKANYLQYKLYDPEGAIRCYKQAYSKFTKDIIKYCDGYVSSQNMSGVYIGNYAGALVECGKEDRAWSLIQLHKHDRRIDPIMFQEIVIDFYFDTKNYQEAEKLAAKAVRNKINIPEYWAYLAKSQAKQNKFDQANDSIQHALSISTEFISTYEVLAEIQMAQSMWTSAIETCEKLVAFASIETEWLEWLGYCHMQIGQFEKAKELYERVVAMDPKDAIAWADLAAIYSRLGQNNLAYSACERSLSFNRLPPDRQEQTIKLLESVKAKKK